MVQRDSVSNATVTDPVEERPSQAVTVEETPQVEEVAPPMEEPIDPSVLRILKRFTFSESVKQKLYIYLDGVLGYREHASGQYLFRANILEGLQLLRSKVGPHLHISLIVGGISEKSFRKQLQKILYEEYQADVLLDEIVLLSVPASY